MKIRIGFALGAVLLALAGCASDANDYSANTPPPPAAAPPQRVNAVSNALGARMDNMLASQPSTGSGVTR
ncbi:MAG TPA: hypothetical protein VGG99_27895 [Acetobacteraceae bacterium]|jgi:hypothetical protein